MQKLSFRSCSGVQDRPRSRTFVKTANPTNPTHRTCQAQKEPTLREITTGAILLTLYLVPNALLIAHPVARTLVDQATTTATRMEATITKTTTDLPTTRAHLARVHTPRRLVARTKPEAWHHTLQEPMGALILTWICVKQCADYV